MKNLTRVIVIASFHISLVDGRYLFAIFGGKLLTTPVRRPTDASVSYNVGKPEQKWTNYSSTALEINPQKVQGGHKKRRKEKSQSLRRYGKYRNTKEMRVIRTRYGFRSISPTRGRPIDSLASSIIGK